MEETLRDNAIYKYLKEEKNSEFIYIIDRTYQICTDILNEVPKEFSNYTFHDIQHVVRVVNYMTDFVKKNLRLYSDFHLALIVLSGLMHDIGMLVFDDEKKEILQELDEGESEEELKIKFQNYIRENHGKRVRKVMDKIELSDSKMKLADIFSIGKSYNFSEEVALICQSHMESCTWITNNINAESDYAEYSCNPQQIALLLRMGDVLDIDDRRAPTYMLKALKVKEYSLTEWEKHPPIKNYNKIDQYDSGEYYVHFSGECKNAFIYRKLQEYISWMEGDFAEINDILSKYASPYKFGLSCKIENRIVPKGFEATSLKFSLDYEKVVNLLMGEHIYGEKRMGLRELIQNSIDAVMVMKEQASREIVDSYTPTICIELDKNNNYVVIHDNGIGMNEDILDRYFFNIGQSYYSSKEYKNAHLKYSAIGRYGIGFLACFMLSSIITMETQSAGREAITIEFEKDSQYVTKKKGSRKRFIEGHGTRIYLNYDEVIGEVFQTPDDLISYVESLLITDGYKLIIRNEGCERKIEKSVDRNGERVIHTAEFDIAYSLKTLPYFMESVEDLMSYKNDMPFYMPVEVDEYSLEDGFMNVKYVLEEMDEVSKYAYLEEEGNETYSEGCDLITECIDDPRVLEIITQHRAELNSYDKLRESLGVAIVKDMYDKGFVSWWEVPYIKEEGMLSLYDDYDEVHGTEAAMAKYIESIRHFAAIGGSQPEIADLVDMANHTVEMDGGDAFYDEDDYSDSFRFPVERVRHRVKWDSDSEMFVVLEKNIALSGNEDNYKVYMHGVWVNGEKIVFPNLIYGTQFNSIRINVKSKEYHLNVSRDEFDLAAREKIYRDAIKAIYLDIADDNQSKLEPKERNLIQEYAEQDL